MKLDDVKLIFYFMLVLWILELSPENLVQDLPVEKRQEKDSVIS